MSQVELCPATNAYDTLVQVRQLDNRPEDSRDDRYHAPNSPVGRVKAPDDREQETEDDGVWPASLRRYLQRAFDNCTKKQGSRQHGQLERTLHRIVTDAMADNRMLTTDWDSEPLPR